MEGNGKSNLSDPTSHMYKYLILPIQRARCLMHSIRWVSNYSSQYTVISLLLLISFLYMFANGL